MLLSSPQLLHDTKSIFCHQVQFFYYHLKSVITNLEWMREMNPQNNLVTSLKNLEILLVIEKLDKIYQKVGNFAPIFSENRRASY